MTKNPLILVAVGFVIVGFGFYHFGLQPKQKEANDIKAKVAETQGRLDAARALLSANQAAQHSFRGSYATVVRLGKAVPGDDDVRSLVVQLDHAADRTHVNFQSIQVGGDGTTAAAATAPTGAASEPLPPGASVGPAGFPVMPFTFSFRGGFFRLGAFFERIDRLVKTNNAKVIVNGRLLTVDGVKLEPDSSGFPNIKATVEATSYLVSPLEGTTGGATPAGPAGATTATTDAAGASTPPTTTATIR